MKGLNLSQFKKLSSDDKSTTLKHPEGHKIVIAHHALSPQHKKELAELPKHYASGGDVEEEGFEKDAKDAYKTVFGEPSKEEKPGVDFASQYNQPAADAKLSISPEERSGMDSVRAEEGPVSSDLGQPIVGPSPASLGPATLAPQAQPNAMAQPADPLGVGAYTNDIRSGVNQYQSAVMGQAKAEGELGQRKASLLEQEQSDMQKLQAESEKRFADYMAKADAVAKAAMEGKVNPNAYMESMSSGSKVATAIGLILGGIGGGLTHQENPAMKFLNQQIERDVEAQKANMSKQQNMMSYFVRQGESVQNATQLSKAFTANIYATKLEAEGAKMQGTMAGNIAKQKAAEIRLQYAPVLQQAAQRSALMGMANKSASGSEADYQKRMNMLHAVSPEMYKEAEENYIPGVGVASIKPSDKDREALASAAQLKKSLTELQARAATIGTTIPGSEADKVNKTKVAAIQLQMKNAYQLGVLSQSDLDMLDKLVANPGSILTNRAISQLEATKQSMGALEKGLYGKLGVTPFQGGGGGMEGRTASDAKGNKIVMKNGQWVPYGR
jgi:hypothetical protein